MTYIRSTLIRGGDGDNLASVSPSGQLAVIPYPANCCFGKSVPFYNPDYGVQIGQDASWGGTPELVHNGTDTAAWTGSNVSGNSATFDSTDQAHSPTHSVKFNNPNVDDVAQFLRASSVDLTNFAGITMWVYVGSGWDAGDDIELQGYDTGTGSPVGTAVSLQNYFTETQVGVWQKLGILLSDMGLEASTVDAFRVRTVAKDLPPLIFYIDDFQLEETDQAITFTLAPVAGTWLHVKNMLVKMIATYDSSVGISPDGFLGVTVESGINYRVVIDGEIILNVNAVNLSDMLSDPDSREVLNQYDGTKTWFVFSVGFPIPRILKHETGDLISFTITEDWSALDFTVTAGVIEEARS